MAACGLERAAQMAAIAELLRLDKLPAPEVLRTNPELDPMALLQELQK
jgi:hypothetical protein